MKCRDGLGFESCEICDDPDLLQLEDFIAVDWVLYTFHFACPSLPVHGFFSVLKQHATKTRKTYP